MFKKKTPPPVTLGFTLGQIVRHKISGGRYVVVQFFSTNDGPFMQCNCGPENKDEYDFSLYEVEPAYAADAVREVPPTPVESPR